MVDDDFSVAQLGASGGLGGLRATAAHEFFHAVQYAYDSSEDAWLTEGTAAWMEDRVADDVDANRRWLRSSALVHPWVPIDSSRGLNEYGAWIFWRFLTESAEAHGPDPTIIRRVWELAADAPRRSGPVLGAAPCSRRSAPATARSPTRSRRSASWNLAPAAFYEEGGAYPQHGCLPAHRVNAAPPDRRVVDDRAEPLWRRARCRSRPVRDVADTSLRLVLDAPRRRPARPRRVLIFMRSGSLRFVTVSLDADGDADLRVPFSAAQVSRVVLVFANASTSFRCWTGAGYSCNGRSRADGMPFSYLATLVH